MRELFAVLFVLAFLCLQTASAESVTLIDDKPTVPAGKAIYYRVYIDITGKEKNIISGSVIETAGYDINFYVFDQKGFNTWWYENRLIGAYVAAQRIKSYSYSFVPDHTDYYYFVLDNKYSWFTNKVPQIKAIWTYQTPKPPVLTLFEPKVVGLTVTISGVANPGYEGASITRITWDWGDGSKEDHWFPATHTYRRAGTYIVTVTAYQSDGLSATKTLSVKVEAPTPTPGFEAIFAIAGLIAVAYLLRRKQI
jgi:PGF-CTERM protein